MKNLIRKENLLTILFLFIAVIFLEGLVFSNQLNYGFRDVDWQLLYNFKLFGDLSLNHLLKGFKVFGAYTSELYYVGILEKIFGLNFATLHLVSHFFKIVAAVFAYILIFKIFHRRLLAFITSLIYTISYTHGGVLFQLASGEHFLAAIFMILFLITYYQAYVEKKGFMWLLGVGILLIASLTLKPERMYPLIALILLTEFLFLIDNKFKKKFLIISLKRVTFVFLLLIFISFLYLGFFKGTLSSGFAPSQFLESTNIRIGSLINGNWQLFIYPFASLGSMFFYQEYWKFLGQLNFQSFESFLPSLIFGPTLILGAITFLLYLFIFKKAFVLSLITTTLIFLFGLAIYSLNINYQNIDPSTRIHFDPNSISIPAIFGFYFLTLTCTFFIKWFRSKDQALAPLAIGSSATILFVFLTWIATDIQLTFMGPHRYLSIPSIGTSLFIGGLLVIIFDRLRRSKFSKQFAWIIFLILIPLIFINYKIANNFFDYELTYAGLRGSDQIRMKNTYRQLLGDISKEDRSLFYFDETQDKINNYFDEGTVMAGFEFWTRLNSDGTLNYFPDPGMIRTNVQCPEHTHQNCINILKQGLIVENNLKGIWYKDPIRGDIPNFYKLNNFYAFRFINKDIVDIKKEVLEELSR